MRIDNPIILKELIQASRHRRMYWVRFALPLLAVLLPAQQILRTLRYSGQDWRNVKDIARPFFETGAWLELIMFSLLAFLYAMSAIRDEWSSRTMEVLCASPLGSARIVYGKFVAVLSRVLLLALALLPVLGIWYHLARVPPEMALGAVAVIFGSILFFATAGLLQAILFGRGRTAPLAWFGLLLPYFLIVIFLDWYVWQNSPLLAAMTPPAALSAVLNGTQTASISLGVGAFSLMSLGALSALSLIGLALAPWLFRRAFDRHIGAGGAKTRRFPTFKRWFCGRRPKLDPWHSPFCWQEQGPATWFLRWALPIVYLVTLPFLAMSAASAGANFEESALVFAIEGLFVLSIAPALYGASVFAREKQLGRSEALLLTGQPPREFLLAKIRATYWALRYAIPAVAAICFWACSYHLNSDAKQDGMFLFMLVAVFCLATAKAISWALRYSILLAVPIYLWTFADHWNDSDTAAQLGFFIEAALLGPAIGVIIGMAFSLAARSATAAILALAGSGLFGVFLFWVIDQINPSPDSAWLYLLFLSGLSAVIALSPLRRHVWSLSALLALSFYIFIFASITLLEYLNWRNGREILHLLIVGSAVTWIIALAWLGLGMTGFERGMKCET